MPTTTSYRKGDRVLVVTPGTPGKWPGVWQVERVNPVSLSLLRVSDGQKLRAGYDFVAPAPASEDACPLHPGDDAGGGTGAAGQRLAGSLPVGQPYEELTWFDPGALVTWTVPPHRRTAKMPPEDTVFAVLADKGKTVNIVQLGGDGGRYWRVTNRPSLRLVTREEMARRFERQLDDLLADEHLSSYEIALHLARIVKASS